MNFWWGIWCGYVLPFLIISSLLSNAIVITLYRHLSKNVKLRFFYALVAIMNIIITIVFHTETTFLGDGLSFVTNGTFYFYLDHMSPLACKSMRFFWGLLETFSRWVVLWFSFERYLLCTGKVTISQIGFRTSLIISGVTLFLSVFPNIPTIFIWNIVQWELSVSKVDCGPIEFKEASLIWAIQASIFWYALPSFITMIFNVLIMRASWKRRKALKIARLLTQAAETGERPLAFNGLRINQRNASLANTYVLVAVTSIEVFYTIPVCLGIIALGVGLALHLDESQPKLFEEIAITHFITLTIPLLQGTSEFIFYTCSIKTFRQKLLFLTRNNAREASAITNYADEN